MDKYYFYGDSNTYGYDPRDPFGGCYPREKIWTGILQDLLADTAEITTDGLNGRQIPDHKRTVELLEMSLEREQPLTAFAVMLGSNDLLLTDNTNTDEIVTRMEKFLVEIQNFLKDRARKGHRSPQEGHQNPQNCQQNPKEGHQYSQEGPRSPQDGYQNWPSDTPGIILIAPPPLHYHEILDRLMEKIWSGYQQIAEKHGWDYVDTTSWNLPLAYDGVHLSEEGHRIFAEGMAEWINSKKQKMDKYKVSEEKGHQIR